MNDRNDCWLCSKFSNGFNSNIIVGVVQRIHNKFNYKGKPYKENHLIFGGKKCPICNGKGFLNIKKERNNG